MNYPEVRNCVVGALVGADLPLLHVYDPPHGTVVSRVPRSAAREVDAAVARCSR